MSARYPIKQLTIKGFKSIKELNALPLGQLNVLIGANGAGKSNFVSYFRMLHEMMGQRLQHWTRMCGGADRILSFGVKETDKVESLIEFDSLGYKFELTPTENGIFSFASESSFYTTKDSDKENTHFGVGHEEAMIKTIAEGRPSLLDFIFHIRDCYNSMSSWKVFHFHDTSNTAGVKRRGALHDNEYLRPDASNLAAFLYRLSREAPDVFAQIRKTIQLAIPFFDDFVLKPEELPTGEKLIWLMWTQKDSDYPFWPSQLSDGSIRFICLATALLQPNPPTTIIIDEPELGLHPYAITLLGALLRSASTRMQVIVSTQSVPLVNEFSIDDLIIVERERGATIFRRHSESEFQAWLEEYSVGELWEKNILEGRPHP